MPTRNAGGMLPARSCRRQGKGLYLLSMERQCGVCRYGLERKPDGQRPSAGTVWCSKRGLQMAKNRDMPCFVALFRKQHYCMDCKRAKITTLTGASLQLGYVWCEKKKAEIHKKRNMDCFE